MIQSVHLTNVRNFQEASFEFGPGITVIKGANGAGKSTILDSIGWAITDKTSRVGNFKQLRTLEESVIELEVGDLQVTKRIVPKVSGGQSVEIDLVDAGEAVRNLNTLTAKKQYILDRLGIEAYLFSNGVFLSQQSDIELLVRPGSAKAFLINLLALSEFVELEKRAKAEVKKLDGQVLSHTSQISGLTSSLRDIPEEEVLRLEAEVEDLHTQLVQAQVAEQEIVGLLSGMSEKYDQIRRLDAQRSAISHQLHTGRDALRDLPEPGNHTRSELQVELEQMVELNVKWTESLARHSAIKEEHQRTLDLLAEGDEKCIACQRPMSDTEKATYLQDTRKKRDNAQRKVAKYRKGLAKLGELKQSTQKSLDLIIEVETATQRVEDLQEQLNGIPETDSVDAYVEVQQRLQTQSRVVADLRNQHTLRSTELRKLREAFHHQEQIREQIEKLQREVIGLQLELGDFQILTDAYGKDGIPKRIIEAHIGNLETCINHNLAILTDSQMELQIVTWVDGKEVFEVVVAHKGYDKPFGLLSGGEKTVVKVASMFGLSDFAGVNVPFRLADEIDGPLDDRYISAAKALLVEKRDLIPQILLVSHRDTMCDLADQVLELEGGY